MNTLQSTQITEAVERDGYAIVRDVIDAELVAEMNAHLEWLVGRYPDLRPEHFHHPLMKHDAFWVRTVMDDRLLDIVELFLGGDIACFTSHYICKPAHDGRPVLWHQDGAYWNLAPMEALTVWLAVDATTPENGCLQVIPGSHRLPLARPELNVDIDNMLYSEVRAALVDELAREHGVVHIELRPGDVSIHHPHVLHCSDANRSPHRRGGLDIGYMRTSTKISNSGLYLDPVLVRGKPQGHVNSYCAYPLYSSEDTIPFRGSDAWDRRAAQGNQLHGLVVKEQQESPLDATRTMIQRLKEGTVKS